MNKKELDTIIIAGKIIKDNLIKILKPERWVVVLYDCDCTVGIGGPGYLHKLIGQSIYYKDHWKLDGIGSPYSKDRFRFATRQEIKDWKESKKRADVPGNDSERCYLIDKIKAVAT